MAIGVFPKAEFQEIARLNPLWSTWTCFAETVKGRNLSSRVIKRYFEKFVEKDDYSTTERAELIKYLLSLTKEKPSTPLKNTQKSPEQSK